MTRLPLDSLIERIADRPDALLNLARTLLAKGDQAQALDLAMRARTAAPDDPAIVSKAAEILSFGVPQWHFTIVRDQVRNDAYEAALKRAIRPGMRVLDIGSGTGLLAMMAARAGAEQVFTCEMNPPVAAAARQVIARNGLADRITVLAKHSDDIDPLADLGGPVDVLVSEIVSNNMLGEAALPVHEKAIRRLVKPGGRVIPAFGRVRVALGNDAQRRRTMNSASGFDLSPFNILAPIYYSLDVGHPRVELMSAPADMIRFDFRSGGPYPEQQVQVTVTAQQDGATGVMQWIALDMDDSGLYENQPKVGTASCWAVLFYPFPENFRPTAGQAVTLNCAHDRHTLRIWPSP